MTEGGHVRSDSTAALPVFVHIGMNKTGSSSIQAHLHRCREELLERGVLYPLAGRWRKEGRLEASHFPLAASLIERHANRFGVDRSDLPWEALCSEIRERATRIVILSSELFWGATSGEIQRLRARLAPHSIRPVLYLRNPLGFLVSSYKQRVKTGTYAGSIEAYAPMVMDRVDYTSIVGRWEDVLGQGGVELRIYDKVRHGLLADFAEVTGIGPLPSGAGSRQTNVSPSDGVVRLLRWVNRLEGGRRSPPGSLRRRARRAVVARRGVGRWIAQGADTAFHGPLVTDRFVRTFREETRETRERFMERYLAPADRPYMEF